MSQKYCQDEIEATAVLLDPALRAHIEAFDFSIVWFLTPQEILTQHEKTKYWHRRFKISPPARPDVTQPPEEIGSGELVYTQCLLAAYSDHLKSPIATVAELAGNPRLQKHFKQARFCFFSADALGRFSRDHFGSPPFESVKKQIYHGVIGVTLSHHLDGFECVSEVAKTAAVLQPPASEITPHVSPADKIGLCHHLANEGEIKWCDND